MYQTGDKGLLKNMCKRMFNQHIYKGLYTMTEVQNNGTVCTHMLQTPITFATLHLLKKRMPSTME